MNNILKLSDTIENIINKAIIEFDGSCKCEPFEEILSIGEIIDRLAIVNFKLYTLKNQVVKKSNDKDFCAWAAKHDVFLCDKRSSLKNCIDAKIFAMIRKNLDHLSSSQPETKLYGED